jgi:Ras-related protein Rab-4A
VKWSGRKQAAGPLRMVRTNFVPPRPTAKPSADVHFLEASSLTGENVEAPFLLAARSILLSIESGTLDPEKAGSGVSYGDRALRRVNSSSRLSFGSLSGGRRRGAGSGKFKLKNWIPPNKCC